jgi:hypothetical protein
LMGEVRANDNGWRFSKTNKTNTEKTRGCSCSSSNCDLTIIQGWLKVWTMWHCSLLRLHSYNGKVVPEVNRAP